MIKLQFQSHLNTNTNTLWKWMISRYGINNELFPLLSMTNLDSLATITEDNFKPGTIITNSWILLFGFIPIDCLHITPIEIVEGEHFIEESPMLTMKFWRHERYIEPKENNKSCVRDILIFQPFLFTPLIALFVKILFKNRHRKLRKKFG